MTTPFRKHTGKLYRRRLNPRTVRSVKIRIGERWIYPPITVSVAHPFCREVI